jgi:hypothetical protein
LLWLIFSAALSLLAALAVLINVSRLRFERRLAAESRALLELSPVSVDRPTPIDLPAPVARYRELAVGSRAPVRTLRVRHAGTFQLSPSAEPRPIQGRQLFTANPPGFIWAGRIKMAPGVWIDARDLAMAGKGNMRVLLDDTLVLADASGPELDLGCALRLLAEMVWYPTALFDAGSVTWSAIDADHARATFRLGEREVSAVFEFGLSGFPSRVAAERYTDKGQLLPWHGVYGDFRSASGMVVPYAAEVSWQLESGTFTYARWRIDSMTYDEEPA